MPAILLIGFLALNAVIPNKVHSQASFSGSSGISTGATGSFSYTVGEPYIIKAVGAEGSMSGGIQQPFHVYTLGVDPGIPGGAAISLFPNPVKSTLTLSLNQKINGHVECELFSIHGTLILRKPVELNSNLLELDGIPPGTYLLNITLDGKQIKSFKVIKN
ncbi:MAG: T9SS type A sorting domain-containing protein [Bacteroidetes bacterium]|nr:T9SS type A sorting domain-containing protein [Bacteroidota bacterium]